MAFHWFSQEPAARVAELIDEAGESGGAFELFVHALGEGKIVAPNNPLQLKQDRPPQGLLGGKVMHYFVTPRGRRVEVILPEPGFWQIEPAEVLVEDTDA